MTELELAIKAHVDNGCVASFKKIPEINGGILDLPENIFRGKDASKYIYEINDDSVNIYISGIKDKTIKCPKYACRPLITMDIICKLYKFGLTTLLLQVLNSLNEPIKLEEILHTKTATNLLDKPEQKKQQILEDELYLAITNFYENQNTDLVSSKIQDGFNIITEYYLNSLNESWSLNES